MSVSFDANVLPDPSSESIEESIFSVSTEMANGTVYHDIIDSQTKYTFTLKWNALTALQTGLLSTAYQTMLQGTLTYTDMNTSTFTVTIGKGRPPLTKETLHTNPLRYRCSITFERAV